MNLKTIPLMALAACGCGISAWAEFSLFVSFAPDSDDLLAPVTAALGGLGVLFVVGQFVMTNSAVQRWQCGQRWLAALCGLTAGVLLAVSIGGTASWFESAFQQQQQAAAPEVNPLDALALAAASQDQATAAGLLATARAEEERGNHWRAGELRRQAAEINGRVQAGVKQLADREAETAPAAVSQAAIAGRLLGDDRGWLWLAIATLTDLIPLLAVVLMAVPTEKQTKPNRRTRPDPQNEPDQTTAREPQTRPNQTSEPVSQCQTEPADHAADQVTRTIADHIQRTGQVPTKREAQAMGVGYTRFSNALAELAGQGVVRPRGRGRGYEVADHE